MKISSPGHFLVLPILFIILMGSCSATKNLPMSEESITDEGLVVNYKKEVATEQTFKIEVINRGVKEVTIYSPAVIHIEVLEGEEWRKVRIQHCPCGADCSPPRKFIILNSGEIHQFRWNLYESWCEKIPGSEIPKAMEKKATPGLYRVLLRYKQENGEKERVYKEFRIVK